MSSKTYAMVKPDAVRAGNAEAVCQLIELDGFQILQKKQLQLTRTRAAEFYAEHKGKSFFDDLIDFMTSGPVCALALAKKNAVEDWRRMMGPTSTQVAQEQDPGSIRALYGSDKTQNAVHGSDSLSSAARELKFFFPKLVQDPLPDGEQARTYIAETLQPTLVKGLTALCKEKPSAGKMEALTWLANWLLENNPNKPVEFAEAALWVPEEGEEEEDDDAVVGAANDDDAESLPDLDDPEMAGAAVKVQAGFRGFQARKQAQAKKAAVDKKAAATMVVVESHTTEANEEEEMAAVKMQSTFKGHQARKQVKAKKAAIAAEENGAATKMQANFRGHQARKQVKAKKGAAAES